MNLKFFLLLLLPLFNINNSYNKIVEECCGKCVGSGNCRACKNCNYCKYCNSGGSCGVCGGGGGGSSYERTPKSSSYPNYTPPSATYKKKVTKLYIVNTKLLNVRSGPGLNYSVIDKIGFATLVTIEKIIGTSWVLIKYNEGGLYKTGYVVKRFIN